MNIGRRLVMGDQHGNLIGVKQALDRANYNPDVDEIICLGDLVDGYPDTGALIDFWIKLAESADVKPIHIRGNHDNHFKDYLQSDFTEYTEWWQYNGMKDTIRSYTRSDGKLNKNTSWYNIESHIEFLENQLDYYIDDDNNGYVHAGFTSRKGLGSDPYWSNYFWDRDTWLLAYYIDALGEFDSNVVEDVYIGDRNHQRFNKHKEIFIGHTPTIKYDIEKDHCKPETKYIEAGLQFATGKVTVPMNRLNLWNVDTGAGYSVGKVTVMDTKTKEFWQSDRGCELYHNHPGR